MATMKNHTTGTITAASTAAMMATNTATKMGSTGAKASGRPPDQRNRAASSAA